jgi:hypothetical protein
MKHTISLSEQTYRALQRQASRSQQSVEDLVEKWVQEQLNPRRSPKLEPVEYHVISGKPEVLPETKAANQETITLELPSEIYDGLQQLAAEDRIDLIQVLAGLVKQARLLQVQNATTRETPATTEPDLLRRIASMAQDLGVDDLAEQHDHYLYGTEKR